MNNAYGLSVTMEYQDGINIIALALNCDSFRIKILVLEILAAVCFVDEKGFNLVLNAMQYYKETLREPFRFHMLIKAIQSEDHQNDEAAFLDFEVREKQNEIFFKNIFNS